MIEIDVKQYEPQLRGNWIAGDMGFAREMISQAKQHNLKTILVDGARTMEDSLSFVENHFQLK